MVVEINHTSTKRLERKETLIGWLYVSPMVIGVLLFTLVPLVISIMAMFREWDALENILQAPMVGMGNFKRIFGGVDTQLYWPAILNTIIFAVQLPICLILGIFLALAMNRKMRGVQAFRVIYYLPGVMSMVAVAIVWKTIFNDDGIINTAFGKSVPWLSSVGGIYFTTNLLLVWKGVGYSTLMFIAGLQSVSTDQIEAAKIDGATDSKIFRAITLPALYPIIFYLFVTGLMGALQMFNEPFVLLGGYGTKNSGMTAVSFVYYAYDEMNNAGLASVGAWILALFIFIITAVQMIVDRKRRDA